MFSEKVAMYFAESLRVNSALQELDLGDPENNEGFGIHLAEMLQNNQTLKDLTLAGNYGQGKEIGKALGKALKVNTSIEKLTLWGNCGVKYLAEALKNNITLQHLELHGDNPLSLEAVESFADALKVNNTLQSLHLGGVKRDFIKECVMRLLDILKENTGLTRFIVHLGSLVFVHDLVNLLLRERQIDSRLKLLKSLFFVRPGTLILSEMALKLMEHPFVVQGCIDWMMDEHVIDIDQLPGPYVDPSSGLLDLSKWSCTEVDFGLGLKNVAISALPDNLVVQGDLNISGSSITKLPNNLFVRGRLYMKNCAYLTKFPEQFVVVGGEIHLEGCINIESVPSCMLEWDGEHTIYAEGSGLSNAGYLQQIPRSGNLRFLFSLENVDSNEEMGEFETTDEAISYWAGIADYSGSLKPFIPPSYTKSVLGFLAKLRYAKEMVIQETRHGLAKRVVEVLETMTFEDDASIKEQILVRMADSLDRCHAKPVWALNQMCSVVLITKARGNRAKLKDVGRRLMNLDVVHQHCKRKCETSNFVDDICIYLKYEIGLREPLDLPVSAVDMHFPSYADVNEDDLNSAKADAQSITEEDFEEWLVNWSEWQRQIRLEQAETLHYSDIEKRSSISWTQSLRNVLGERIEDGISLNSCLWSFHDLLKHWVETGCDLNNTKISFQHLKENLKRMH